MNIRIKTEKQKISQQIKLLKTKLFHTLHDGSYDVLLCSSVL